MNEAYKHIGQLLSGVRHAATDAKKGGKMKALAYRNYVQGQDGYLCCACVERDQRQHDYPHLFFATTKPEKIDEKLRCAWCGYPVGGHDASCAAKRIATMIKGR